MPIAYCLLPIAYRLLPMCTICKSIHITLRCISFLWQSCGSPSQELSAETDATFQSSVAAGHAAQLSCALESLSPALCQRRSPLGLNALAARMLMQAVSLSFRLLLPVSVGRSRFRRQSKHLGPSCKSTLPKNVGRPQCNDQGG